MRAEQRRPPQNSRAVVFFEDDVRKHLKRGVLDCPRSSDA
jgi:hypothetical protein